MGWLEKLVPKETAMDPGQTEEPWQGQAEES